MKKALSINNIMSMKHETIPFTGEWLEAFGEPERTGTWFVWGASGSGKSTFALMLCKELCRHGRVLYNSIEEGTSLAFKNRLERLNTGGMGRRFNIVSENMDSLSERLLRRRSADFIVIDSFQYTKMDYNRYVKFKEKHPNKLLIFISHADGKFPLGRSAKAVRFDAALKVWVEGFKAKSSGRFIGVNGGTFTIWEEGSWKFGSENN
jgi:KaiC/GvpD/RAD55 family RecA-like ATPase